MTTNLLQLGNYVQEQGELGRQRRTRDLLAGRAADAFTAETPDAQRTAVADAIRVDPQAGFAINSQVADENTRRGTQLYNMARGLKAIQAQNPQAAAAYYEQQLVPGLRRMGLEVPDVYDAQRVGAGIDQVLAMWGPTGSLVQSTYVNGNGDRVAILRDGTERVLGPNSATIRVVEQEGQVPVGVVTSGGRAGSTVAIGAPGAAATAPAPVSAPQQVGATTVAIDGVTPERSQRIAAVADSMRTAGYPDAEIDAWVSSQSDAAPAVAATPAAPTPSLVRTPTAAETARATQDAKNASDISAYERMTGLAADREAATTTARENAQAQAQKSQALPQTLAAADETIALLSRVRNHPGREAATGASAVNPLNRVPGTDAYDFNVLLDQIKGQAFLQAFQSLRGGGAITEREGQAATNAIARLNAAQSEGEFISAIDDLSRIVAAGRSRAASGAGQSSPSASGAPSASVPRATNPRTGETIEFRNGKWGPAR